MRPSPKNRGRLALLAGALLVASFAATAHADPLKTYQSRYYVIHSDLDGAAVREADLRITAMAEMYHQLTSGFGGKITRKLPFYLFSSPQAYYAAGGMPGSVGMFTGDKLMAISGNATGDATWHIIQHEGFHQFVYAVIGGDIPIWVNEGLAEYFGQALFTGDRLISGIIPPARLERLKQSIRSGKTRSIAQMMQLSHAEWNVRLNAANYDQAWSMVHFIGNADNGRYQTAFNNFARDVSRGMSWEHAWKKHFGTGTREFEQKWREYWLGMSDSPTTDLYAEWAVGTLTNFIARAASQRQFFASFEEFSQAGKGGRLMMHRDDWLPSALLEDALTVADNLGQWELKKLSGRYQVICTLPDGTRLAGTFRLAQRRVKPGSVKVTIRSPR